MAVISSRQRKLQNISVGKLQNLGSLDFTTTVISEGGFIIDKAFASAKCDSPSVAAGESPSAASAGKSEETSKRATDSTPGWK